MSVHHLAPPINGKPNAQFGTDGTRGTGALVRLVIRD